MHLAAFTTTHLELSASNYSDNTSIVLNVTIPCKGGLQNYQHFSKHTKHTARWINTHIHCMFSKNADLLFLIALPFTAVELKNQDKLQNNFSY